MTGLYLWAHLLCYHLLWAKFAVAVTVMTCFKLCCLLFIFLLPALWHHFAGNHCPQLTTALCYVVAVATHCAVAGGNHCHCQLIVACSLYILCCSHCHCYLQMLLPVLLPPCPVTFCFMVTGNACLAIDAVTVKQALMPLAAVTHCCHCCHPCPMTFCFMVVTATTHHTTAIAIAKTRSNFYNFLHNGWLLLFLTIWQDALPGSLQCWLGCWGQSYNGWGGGCLEYEKAVDWFMQEAAMHVSQFMLSHSIGIPVTMPLGGCFESLVVNVWDLSCITCISLWRM